MRGMNTGMGEASIDGAGWGEGGGGMRGRDAMHAVGRWRSEETEDGERCHACHGKVEE